MNWYKAAIDIRLNGKFDSEYIVNQLVINHPSIFVKIFHKHKDYKDNFKMKVQTYSLGRSKIETIKFVRSERSMDLKEAKELVEKWCNFNN